MGIPDEISTKNPVEVPNGIAVEILRRIPERFYERIPNEIPVDISRKNRRGISTGIV